MYAEDAIVSKLLSLRFYEFSDGDRHGLDKNISNNVVRSVVSEAARQYLHTVLERGEADPDHLENIIEWLVAKGRAISADVMEEYTSAVEGLRDGTVYQGGVTYSHQVVQPRF